MPLPEPATLIDKGFMSEVYAWGEGRCLKLFESWVPPAKAELEYKVTRAVHGSGFPCPAAYGLIEHNGRQGMILERIDGISLYSTVVARPWRLFDAARQLAEIHASLHCVSAPPELPTQRQKLVQWIDASPLTAKEKEAARKSVALLPDGDTLCHGDFHPANILLTQRGPVVIDWTCASRGYALGDAAATSLLFEVAELPKDAPLHIHALLKCSRRMLHSTYLKHYFRLRPGNRKELAAWRSPRIAAVFAWRAAWAAR